VRLNTSSVQVGLELHVRPPIRHAFYGKLQLQASLVSTCFFLMTGAGAGPPNSTSDVVISKQTRTFRLLANKLFHAEDCVPSSYAHIFRRGQDASRCGSWFRRGRVTNDGYQYGTSMRQQRKRTGLDRRALCQCSQTAVCLRAVGCHHHQCHRGKGTSVVSTCPHYLYRIPGRKFCGTVQTHPYLPWC
jgi:hypothetical protein